MKHANVPRSKTILIIMDGFGVNPSKRFNAVYEANTPNFDRYFGQYPHTTLQASGRAVGLPDGQMGNSEVGHMTIGCGSILKQDLVRIDDAVEDRSLYENPALLAALQAAKAAARPLHLIGLLSDGGVHSHINHVEALMQACHTAGVKAVLHAVTDGRDTAPKAARQFVSRIVATAAQTGGEIATISGRFYAMDRDKRWERTKLAWDALVNGQGIAAADPLSAIDDAYAAGETDEFIKPRIMPQADLIQGGDQVLFFNFRNDRPRQTSEALAMADFSGFGRGNFQPAKLTTMTLYDSKYNVPVLFPPERPTTNLAQTLSDAGVSQFHCAETEKYAHVTFFFNSGRETPYEGEARLVIPSPNVETYDLKPEMSAPEVADATVAALEKGEYGFIVVNFANGDMVGHTAVGNAVVQAVEALDREVGRVLDAAVAHGYSVILTADHGNCDEYIDPLTGEPNTQHTVYPVPCLVIDQSHWRLSTGGGLSNLAPTVLQLMGLPKPDSMGGKSLLLEEMPR
ncbi:2,3-bisphosphoglycerate-independent phosphoglycerate mutase [Candidatus Thiothrix sp. Deng01]|uniref:2,3-bisphosphoglycerate-independent phosphoglycerate mutase n=1 Tax=Candidatus Thiothrix phosphatis TaxID=3112415 RepID=A0ABU6CT66_9GAMM|nr:2,3-bisphosphoglycerate-independent phosphoglycerate mutase [Candidatus Thiothrix sp. Deng01]MEB4589727.1 2,3-bisphosphoglycerate-independent phosphoglycerate mutase [Candidatus Thiothrix sp. Deng01]